MIITIKEDNIFTLEQTASSVLYKLGQTSLNFALTESTDALSPR